MIELCFINGEVLVFSADDWKTLRKTFRIIGVLSGDKYIPVLPMKLLPEEVLLLLDKGIAKVVSCKTKHDLEKYKQFQTLLLQQQEVLYKDRRRVQLEAMIDKILTAKRAKGDTRSKEDIFNEELEKSSKVTEQSMIWPIPQVPFDDFTETQTEEVPKEVFLKKTTAVKSAVFRDLWEQGNYVTSGENFGGHFLVYEGDPVVYHSINVVRCVEHKTLKAHLTDYVALGRVSHHAKKVAVLAFLECNGKVSYISVKWSGI